VISGLKFNMIISTSSYYEVPNVDLIWVPVTLRDFSQIFPVTTDWATILKRPATNFFNAIPLLLNSRCTCSVTFWHVRVTIVPVEAQQCILCVLRCTSLPSIQTFGALHSNTLIEKFCVSFIKRTLVCNGPHSHISAADSWLV